MLPSLDLADKVAVITGASRGIGRSTAEVLALAGAKVHGIARSTANLDSIKERISYRGGNFSAHACDISDFENLSEVMKEITRASGKIDILINNAGIYSVNAVRNIDLSQWSATLAVNCSAAFVATKSVLDEMIKRRFGRIIFISSISGKSAEAYGAAYSASKFGMLGLMQSVALEVASYGITSNAICPGWVDTDMAHYQINDEKWCALNAIEPNQAEEITRLSVPQERLIEPLEVAQLALYLCSDAARGITGQAMNICGGLSLL